MLLPASAASASTATAELADYEPMDALKGKDYGKPRMRFGDFNQTETGLQYKELREGSGEPAQPGDTVVLDWAGYTIGYYGRPFEARNKPKGSSFSGDKDFVRYQLGSGQLIPGVEEAVAQMRPGAIWRLIVPVELGYPDNDWHKQGPAPSTFAGQRALDFVLQNKGMIDKTLLFDVELVRVVPKA